MMLNVQLFGPMAAAAGARVIRLEMTDASSLTAGEVLRQLAAVHPRLCSMLAASRLAVNCAFVAADHPVSEVDELALIAMVSGG